MRAGLPSYSLFSWRHLPWYGNKGIRNTVGSYWVPWIFSVFVVTRGIYCFSIFKTLISDGQITATNLLCKNMYFATILYGQISIE